MHSPNSPQPLPDLVLVLRRDGRMLSWTGGDALRELREKVESGADWSEGTSALFRRLARQCIAERSPLDASLQEGGVDLDLRVTPQGPDRVVCTLRRSIPKVTDDTPDETGLRYRPGLERRGFTRQLRDRLARAALQERPLSVAVIHIDGLPGIAQSVGSRMADRVMNAVLQAIPRGDPGAGEELLGQLGENVIALAMDSADRPHIEARVSAVCQAIREPHQVDGLQFRLAAWSGIASTGHDRSTPTQLLDQASAAAMEARQAGRHEPRFHTDTVRVRALDRLDLVRELRDAVSRQEIGLRFTPRHDLATGGLTTSMSYLHWTHPFRGHIRPTEFLNIAEGTGIGAELSKAALQMLCTNFRQHTQGLAPHVRVSYGPLRDHVMDPAFADDVLAELDEHGISAERFELRIAERTLVACEPVRLQALVERGARIVIDEVGRNHSSLAHLARAPLWGLQLDRSWAAAPAGDFNARAVCRAVAALAAAFGIEALATGVDDERRRDVLRDLGYRYGSGDFYSSAKAGIPAR